MVIAECLVEGCSFSVDVRIEILAAETSLRFFGDGRQQFGFPYTAGPTKLSNHLLMDRENILTGKIAHYSFAKASRAGRNLSIAALVQAVSSSLVDAMESTGTSRKIGSERFTTTNDSPLRTRSATSVVFSRNSLRPIIVLMRVILVKDYL